MRVIVTFVFCVLMALPVAAQQAPAEEDGSFLERFLEDKLSGAGRAVTVTGFAGALSAQATLEEMTIADGTGVWITLSGVTLDWSRAALLRGRLSVANLSAEEIHLSRLPEGGPEGVSRAEAKPFALPDLPVSIEIGKISTERLTLDPAVLGQSAVLQIDGALSLDDGAGRAQLAATRSDAEGIFSLNAGFSNETRELGIDLDFNEAAGGLLSTRLGLPGAPPLALTIVGAGPLQDFAADLALTTDEVPRVTGALRLQAPTDSPEARQFTLTAAGDLGALVAPRLRPFFGDQSNLDLRGLRQADGGIVVDQLALSTQALTLGGTLALAPGGRPLRVSLDGRLDGPVALPLAGPETLMGGADLRARFDAARGDGWTAQLDLDGLSRAGLSLGTARLVGAGVIRPDLFTAMLDLSLDGLAHTDPALARALGPALSGQAEMSWQQGARPQLVSLRLDAADARLAAEGMLGPLDEGLPFDGTAELALDDLARLAPLAGRPLAGAAQAQLSGSYTALGGAFDLTLSATTHDLVTGTAQLDPLLAGPGQLRLSALRDAAGTQLRALDIETAAVGLSVAGDLSTSAGGLSVTARAPDLALVDPGLAGPASVQARMGWQAGGLLRLDQLLAEVAGATLSAEGTLVPDDPALPVDLNLSVTVPRLAAFAGLTGRNLSGAAEARLQAKGAVRGPGDASVQLNASARDLALGLGAADTLWRGQSALSFAGGRRDGALVIEALDLDSAGLQASAVTRGASGVLEISAKLADLAALMPGLPGALTLAGDVTPEGKLLRLDLNAQGPGGLTAVTRGTIASDGGTTDLELFGRAPLALANAAIAPRSVEGEIRFDLALKGKPGLSALSGQIATADARLALSDLSATVTGLSGQVALAGGRAQVNLSGDLGGGRVDVGGTLALSAPYTGDLAVTLAQVGLRDPALYDTRLDGQVTLRGPLTGGATIAGQIMLGQTEITVPSGSVGGAGPIPEIAHRGAPGAVQATRARAGLIGNGGNGGGGRPFPLDIVIEAPGRIFVRGRGLDAELGGRLRLRGTTADVVPEGRFELIRGRLDILSKRFALTEGRVELQGALDPYLRFVATTETGDITAKVVIEGLASAPELSFTSDPELPDEEVLAQILFGQGLENLSALQAAELAAAVATLAGGGGGGLLSRLRSSTGLDDLDVSRTDSGGTQLRVGKYLSENIYSEVALDDEGTSTIELNIDVTPQVTVRGQLGADGDTGVGIFYERDY